jgi:hypothetical protein
MTPPGVNYNQILRPELDHPTSLHPHPSNHLIQITPDSSPEPDTDIDRKDAILQNPSDIPGLEMLRHIRHHGPSGPKTAPIQRQTMGDTREPGFCS